MAMELTRSNGISGIANGFLGSRWSAPALMLAGAVAFSGLILVNPTIALFVALVASAVPLLVYVVSRDALNAALAMLLVLPLHNSPVLNPNLMGIQGMKPFNLVALCAIGAAALVWLMRRGTERNEVRILLIFFAYWAVWTTAFLRSLGNYAILRYSIRSEAERGVSDYILSFYIRPSLFAFLFPTIVILARSEQAIDRTMRAFGMAVFVLSCGVFAVVLANISAFAGGRDAMNGLFEEYLGLHYNSIGTMYIVAIPSTLVIAIQRGWFWKLNFLLAFLAVVLIGSRSALLVTALSAFVTLILLRRTGIAVAGTLALGALVAVVAAPSVSGFLYAGVQRGSALSVDGLLNGRETLFWVPLLSEWWEEPSRFWLGAGLYGILTSRLGLANALFGVTHAHNGLINFFLDSGIILTIILVLCLAVGMIWATRIGRRIASPQYWGLYVGLCAYLVATLTERGFYPSYDNVLVFPALALMLNLARLHDLPRSARKGGGPAENIS